MSSPTDLRADAHICPRSLARRKRRRDRTRGAPVSARTDLEALQLSLESSPSALAASSRPAPDSLLANPMFSAVDFS